MTGRCDFCGRVHEGCHGHREARKYPCGGKVVPGKNFCRKHFNLLIARNRPRLFSEELKDVADPLPFLQETIAEIVAFKELASEKLAGLSDDAEDAQGILAAARRALDMPGRDSADKDAEALRILREFMPMGWRFTDDKGGEQLRSEVAIFERAMDRCVKWLHSLATIHLEERLVRIEEAKADLVIEAFNRALTNANLPKEQENVIVADFAAGVRRQAG